MDDFKEIEIEDTGDMAYGADMSKEQIRQYLRRIMLISKDIQNKVAEGELAFKENDFDMLIGNTNMICDRAAGLRCEAAAMLNFMSRKMVPHICEDMRSFIGKIQIAYTKEKWLKVTLGKLLPHKKNTRLKPLFYQEMYRAIYHFIRKEGLKVFSDAVIIIKNVYHEKKKHFIRDNDNVEVSVIINTLGAYFLPDDAGQYCDLFMCSDFRDHVGTEIFLVPRSEYVHWMEQERNTTVTGL